MKGFHKTIKKYGMLSQNDGIIIGLSGGADSVALLALLRGLRTEYALSLYAVHVNHGLRGAAAQSDEAFVRGLCEAWEIPLRVVQVNIRDEVARGKISIEEAGRRKRYDAFYEGLEKINGQKIAVGHNKDDNAETVVMNLCRGAGLRGLSGIAPVSGQIIRPLIETPRAEIEAYLMKQGIKFVQDISNAGYDYTRNRIRHIVLPALEKHVNTNAAVNITRNLPFLRADADFLEEAARNAYAECLQDKNALHIPALLNQPVALQYRIIREAIYHARITYQIDAEDFTDIHAIHITDALNLANGRTGSEAHLPSLIVRREYAVLRFLPASKNDDKNAENTGFCYPLVPNVPRFVPEINKTIALQVYTQVEACDMLSGLCVRTRQKGDKISRTKKLQDYFVNEKVPRHVRDSIALVAAGSQVLWILDAKNKTYPHPIGGESMAVKGESVEILYTKAQIDERLESLAEEINRDYGDKPIVLVCALTGGVFFLADLARKLGNATTLDFIRASSYGDGTTSSGTVALDCHPRLELKGKDVIIIEDIIDTGRTLAHLQEYFAGLGAASLRICALLDKPSRREIEGIQADYVGFSIPDAFVVGYGLDYAQRYRNLPYVGVLKFTE
ncbi:MAG: hypoxanthine phosphoribosyltransferase [Defluviitaleaceae bacterium]|nr:hypoxanthine phosphoribosyltransferase [Defluviitaleaceae bacterium]MCL2276048.1 hypoxanthine phosphoribosyltransferase [Defluviitaleaceae bacterium]